VSVTHRADYANNIGYVAIFLKAFGVNKLLKKSERPHSGEKMVRARADEELVMRATAVWMHDSFSKYFATITSRAIN